MNIDLDRKINYAYYQKRTLNYNSIRIRSHIY